MHGLYSLKEPMCIKHILNYDETGKNCLILWMAAPEQNVDHSFYLNDSLKLFEKHHIIVLPSCHNNNSRKFDPDI